MRNIVQTNGCINALNSMLLAQSSLQGNEWLTDDSRTDPQTPASSMHLDSEMKLTILKPLNQRLAGIEPPLLMLGPNSKSLTVSQQPMLMICRIMSGLTVYSTLHEVAIVLDSAATDIFRVY